MIEALEGMVLDQMENKYLRGVAWLRLLKVWGSLRFSCHNYLTPSRLSMFEGELYGVLKKTKTTGPTRRVRELPLHVSKMAYIRFQSWLSTGFELWQTLAPFERDYFLPRSTADGNHTLQQMAEYSDASAAGIQVLSKLMLPGTSRLLLDPNWCCFFTEHSERPTLATALAVLQHSKEERDLVGRWKPEGSDVYVRTYHAIIGRLQARVAEVMRSSDRYVLLQEKEIAHSFKAWCRDRLQLNQEEAEEMADIFADTLRKPPLTPSTIVQPAQVVVDDDGEAEPLAPEASSDSSEDPAQDAWFLAKNRPTNVFLIIHSAKGARLHKSDGCWIARYRSVKHPEFCQMEPSPSDYDFRCRMCWPSGLPDEASSQESDEEVEQHPPEEESEPELVQGDDQVSSSWSVTHNTPFPPV